MIDISTIFGVIIYLIFAIIITWKTTLLMIEKKRIIIFLPFLIVGVIFCFYVSFLFYNIFDEWPWLVLKSAFAIVLIWILINVIRRENGLFN